MVHNTIQVAMTFDQVKKSVLHVVGYSSIGTRHLIQKSSVYFLFTTADELAVVLAGQYRKTCLTTGLLQFRGTQSPYDCFSLLMV